MDIEKLIADLKAQGLDDEKIIASLEQMAQEGKIAPEDLEKAKQLLGGANPAEAQPDPEQEKKEAGDLFGLKLL